MLLSIFLSVGLLSADRPGGMDDLLPTDSLQAVTITAEKGIIVSRTDTLSVKKSFTISDALFQCPGLYIGDNGGSAGLKTISLRGLGSAHTSIYIDGVRVGNVQSGQNDLGMLDTDIYGSVVVDYAQNSVSFNTLKPTFTDDAFAGRIGFHAGSFGTYNPSARLDFKLSDRLLLSANASAHLSKGDFKLPDGLVRTNNDIKQFRGGVDLFGNMSDGEYHLKAYCNSSERGTPGSMTWPSEDRQQDMNAFVQGSLKKRFSDLYTLHLALKGSYDDIYYTSSWGDSEYGQTEYQFNMAHDFQILSWWKLTFAADTQMDDLKSSNYSAFRTTLISALASSFTFERFAGNVALEYNGAFDRGLMSRYAFSPSADIRYSFSEDLGVMAFARRAFRIPTFNELYYVGYGNPELKPEDAWLTDVCLDYKKSLSESLTIRSKADVFYNLLTDKITSAPTPEDPNIWQPYNIGQVRSAGFDLIAGFEHKRVWRYGLDARYSYLSAIDITPESYLYGTQIPYIARHTFILDASVEWKGWMLASLWQLRSGRTDSSGDMPSWSSLDLVLSKSFNIKGIGDFDVRIAVKNLYDCRYEVVSGYPMPGRSVIGGVFFKF